MWSIDMEFEFNRMHSTDPEFKSITLADLIGELVEFGRIYVWFERLFAPVNIHLYT